MVTRKAAGVLVALVTVATVAMVATVAGGVVPAGRSSADKHPQLFETSEACVACHSNTRTGAGEDVSFGPAWRASMMANSARDPYWHASVRREVLDHPKAAGAIEGECSKCHMPMSHVQAHAEGRPAQVFAHLPIGSVATPDARLAADGVSCTVCHQIRDTLLGTPASFNGGFVIDIARPWRTREVFGPFAIDSGRARIMHSSSAFQPVQGAHVQKSELCATCHTLYTSALDTNGNAVGRFPEQVPFLEWMHSEYRRDRSCQHCHMPVVKDSVRVSGVWGQPRAEVSRHDFRGGNFFMLAMLNRYRVELGVEALAEELDSAVRSTTAHLTRETAQLSIEDAQVESGHLRASIVIRNLTGHKLPTAYPSRRVWVHFSVRDGSGRMIFESGALEPTGAIRGNDNDANANAFEPHYREITSPDQVQIYEAVIVDSDGKITTGLLSARRYEKDNRLLPSGFDKASAMPDIAVHGVAASDGDFTGGGDRVVYAIDLQGGSGPLVLSAELMFQPIGFRWARNLGLRPSPEATRFLSYFDSMATGSAIVLTSATSQTR